MNYPRRILPSPNYHNIKEEDVPFNAFLLRQIRRKHQVKTIRVLRSKCESILSASEFYKGISCNLLSTVFRKEHSFFIPSNDAELGYIEDWHPGDSPILPTEGNCEYLPWQGYCGFKVSDLYEFEADIPIKNKNGTVVRTDVCLIRFEHAPTLCNFWHFNLFLYAKHSNTGEIYNLKDPEKGVSKSQLTKIATALADDFAPLLRTGKSLKCTYITKSKYQ